MDGPLSLQFELGRWRGKGAQEMGSNCLCVLFSTRSLVSALYDTIRTRGGGGTRIVTKKTHPTFERIGRSFSPFIFFLFLSLSLSLFLSLSCLQR